MAKLPGTLVAPISGPVGSTPFTTFDKPKMTG